MLWNRSALPLPFFHRSHEVALAILQLVHGSVDMIAQLCLGLATSVDLIVQFCLGLAQLNQQRAHELEVALDVTLHTSRVFVKIFLLRIMNSLNSGDGQSWISV